MGDRGPGELMGPYEIAQRLNVSRSRFQQIAMRPSFPKPYQELRGMKVWLRVDVEAWIAEHRPPRVTDGDEQE
ncbi:helix-turn-helix transcriptional regulator [Micromonospora sp. LZ34]